MSPESLFTILLGYLLPEHTQKCNLSCEKAETCILTLVGTICERHYSDFCHSLLKDLKIHVRFI